jgi:hypothetical protein
MYRFYSSPESQNRVTVVGVVENDVLKIAVAICSKKDRFVRKIGRSIAEGRLKKGIYYETCPLTAPVPTKDFIDIAQRIANEVVETKQISKD